MPIPAIGLPEWVTLTVKFGGTCRNFCGVTEQGNADCVVTNRRTELCVQRFHALKSTLEPLWIAITCYEQAQHSKPYSSRLNRTTKSTA